MVNMEGLQKKGGFLMLIKVWLVSKSNYYFFIAALPTRPQWGRGQRQHRKVIPGLNRASSRLFMGISKAHHLDQIHKLNEGLSLNLGNMTLYPTRLMDVGGSKRGEDREGRPKTYRWQSLRPSGGLRGQKMINKREGERQWQRERDQLYLCQLLTCWTSYNY